MLKGKQKVKRGENQNLYPFVKGGLVMSRNILAGLVVLTLVLWGSTAMADCGNALSYQVFTDMAKNTATVKVFLANNAGIAGGSIPISFSALGTDIQCTKIDFAGSRIENFQLYPQIDNQNKRVLIGMIRALNEEIDDVLKPGDGLLVTMNFTSKSGTLPELKLSPWQLSGGKLYYDLVDEKGSSVCEKNRQDADIPIPVKPGGASDAVQSKPASFNLEQNYPNPFNPETVIKFSLPEDSRVSLKIYNVLGQVVSTPVNENLPAGFHSVTWDGKNEQGSEVASGVYFYRIKAGNYESIMKMTLLR
jgi:hypothetical protein